MDDCTQWSERRQQDRATFAAGWLGGSNALLAALVTLGDITEERASEMRYHMLDAQDIHGT